MKNLFSAPALSFALLVSTSAFAAGGSAAAGNPRLFHAFSDNGHVIFETTGVRLGVPTCASAKPQRFVFDGTTAAGKAVLSELLFAAGTGKTIVVQGKGTCNLGDIAEDLLYFYIND